MTHPATSRLLSLARAATPGPWRMDGADVSTPSGTICRVWGTAADAAYIAAASPDVIAALCERVILAEEVLDCATGRTAKQAARIAALEAGLREACELADYWQRGEREATGCEPDDDPRIAALRALAITKP